MKNKQDNQIQMKNDVQISLNPVQGKFDKKSSFFKKLHTFLVEKGILDGSKDTLVADLLDGFKDEKESLAAILSKINVRTPVGFDSMIYLALSGIHYFPVLFQVNKMILEDIQDVQHDPDDSVSKEKAQKRIDELRKLYRLPSSRAKLRKAKFLLNLQDEEPLK